MEVDDNNVFIGKISVKMLAENYGSPLYAYDESVIRKQFGLLKDSIVYEDTDIHFACKANSNIRIMSILQEEGALVDTASCGEIFLSHKAGYSYNNILFTGHNVTEEEMMYIIEHDVTMNVDSLTQLRRSGQIKLGLKVGIRFNLDVGAGYHPYVYGGGPRSKFGIRMSEIEEAKEIVENFGLHVSGVHTHIGSGILDAQIYLDAFDRLLSIASNFVDIDYIDIGGGIGIPYKNDEQDFNLKYLGEEISSRLVRWCLEYGKKIRLKLEPGRFLVAKAGTLICKVNTIKNYSPRIFVGTDTSFAH